MHSYHHSTLIPSPEILTSSATYTHIPVYPGTSRGACKRHTTRQPRPARTIGRQFTSLPTFLPRGSLSGACPERSDRCAHRPQQSNDACDERGMRSELAAERARAHRLPSSTLMLSRTIVSMGPSAGPVPIARDTSVGESELLVTGEQPQGKMGWSADSAHPQPRWLDAKWSCGAPGTSCRSRTPRPRRRWACCCISVSGRACVQL